MKPIAALAFVLLGATPTVAQDLMRDLHHYFLPNGLEVVLAPDQKVPKVVVDVHYKVGSMNEPAGRSGFAHLFEHLMFTGTEMVPDIDWTYSAEGVDLNAWTWEDKTFYYTEGLSSTLPLMLSVEADRMANVGASVGDEQLDVERAIVLNEMRQNVLDTVGESALEAMRTGLFQPDHPYSRSVIGSMPDLEAATLEDARSFFQTYYAPNNAVLVVVGDFDASEAVALIGRTFGQIPRGPEVLAPLGPELVPTKLRLRMEDRVPTPTLMIGFAGGGQLSPDSATMPLLSEILGNPDYGILRDRLVATGLATSISATFERGLLGSKLIFEIPCAEGVDPAAVEAAFMAALAEYLQQPVDAAELERARRSALIAQRVEIEPLAGRGERLALETAVYGTPETGLVDNPRIAAVTVADLDATRQKWLQPEAASIITIMPGTRGGYPTVLTQSTGTPEPLPGTVPQVVAMDFFEAKTPGAASLPVAEETTLTNGIRVIHYTLPDAPLSYLAAVSDAGTASDRPGEEGLIQLAVEAATYGTEALDLSAFSQVLRDMGGSISGRVFARGTAITLSAPPEMLGAGVKQFSDVLLRPRFDAAEWAILQASTVDQLKSRNADAGAVAALVAEWELMPPDETAPAPDRTVASVERATLPTAREMFGRLFTPGSTTFVSVGPLPLSEVVAELETQFASWMSGDTGLEDRPRKTPAFPGEQRVIVVDEKGASQTAIYIARPGPGFEEAGYPESLSVIGSLSRNFLSRLNAMLRETKGLSYGTDGYVHDAFAKAGMMVATAPVDAGRTGEALLDMLTGFAGLASAPITEDEVRNSVTATQMAQAGLAETGAGFFDEVLYQIGRGASMDLEAVVLNALVNQDLGAVRREAAALAVLDDAVIVLVGDSDVVIPQLSAIGITALETRPIPGTVK